MKIKKIVATFTLASALVLPMQGLALTMDVPNIQSSGIVTPFWANVSDITAKISKSGKTLYSKANINAKSSSAKITGTIYLEKYSGSSWTNVTSWSISGTGNLSVEKNYTGTTGTQYRTRVVATVDGEQVSATSSSITL